MPARTGIGLLIEVDGAILEETGSYPAYHRYRGIITTPEDEMIHFVTDRAMPQGVCRAVARPGLEGVVEVAEFIQGPVSRRE